MIERSRLFAIIIVSALLIGIIGVVAINHHDAEGTIEVVDMRGRTVSVDSNVDSIVCLSASSVRLVSYFGPSAVDKIVGVDNYDSKNLAAFNYYKATYRIAYNIESKTNVGNEENFEAIINTGAKVIFSSVTDASALNTLQEKTGIPVVGVAADGNIDVNEQKFKDNIKLVGKVLGMGARANELITGINNLLNELNTYKATSAISADCYIGGMFYMMQGNLYMTTGDYMPFTLTKAVNKMPDTNNGNPYTTTKGNLMTAKPDYIFIDSMTLAQSHTAYSTDKSDLESVIPAVQNGNVYSTLIYKFYGTNWETELINAFYVGKVLDPSTYNYVMKDKANEILSLFFPGSSVDYDSVVEKVGSGYGQLNW